MVEVEHGPPHPHTLQAQALAQPRAHAAASPIRCDLLLCLADLHAHRFGTTLPCRWRSAFLSSPGSFTALAVTHSSRDSYTRFWQAASRPPQQRRFSCSLA